ncbi:hypothetical protein NMY22_g11603 [Coprinellus aureogranulatus]|nr:hypothetical protein NMY22_g11603 [Coprinellus aureogranulatus]
MSSALSWRRWNKDGRVGIGMPSAVSVKRIAQLLFCEDEFEYIWFRHPLRALHIAARVLDRMVEQFHRPAPKELITKSNGASRVTYCAVPRASNASNAI